MFSAKLTASSLVALDTFRGILEQGIVSLKGNLQHISISAEGFGKPSPEEVRTIRLKGDMMTYKGLVSVRAKISLQYCDRFWKPFGVSKVGVGKEVYICTPIGEDHISVSRGYDPDWYR